MLRGKINTVLLAVFFICVFFAWQSVRAANDDIIINEIGAYESNGQEWIEIYNRGNDAIDLLNWKFWENETNHGLSVSTTDGIMSAGEYGAIVQDASQFKLAYPNFTGSVFDSSWGSLKESGEEIGLKDDNGNFIEQFIYISAPNFSLERKDPFLINYTNNNWAEHATANSLGEQNSIYEIINQTNTTTTEVVSSTDFVSSTTGSVTSTIDQDLSDNFADSDQTTSTTSTVSQTTSSTTTTIIVDIPTSTPTTTNFSVESVEQLNSWTPEQWNKIKINEIVSNPQTGNEWVELYNISTTTINLSEGSICDNRLAGCKMVSGTITSQGYLVIDLNTKSFLNNDGDSVILLNPDDDEVDHIDYNDSFGITDKGQSLARKTDGVDINNNSDWAVTTQITQGTTNVIVAPVVNSGGSQVNNQTNKQINTETTKQLDDATSSTSTVNSNSSTILTTGNIVLSELLPNPVGSDAKGEYIRITNLSSSTINLSGWKLADLAKSVKLSGFINSGQSIFWLRTSTTIALNNTKVEVVSLTDYNNKLVDKVGYNKADEGMVYRRYGEEWRWEELNPTLGVGGNFEDEQVKILDANQVEIEKLVAKLETQADDIEPDLSSNYIKTKVSSKSYVALSLIQAREADKGELAVVRGIVSTLPGVFGSQYFYITDGQNGLQIYNYKKEFLDLEIGDLVEVRGEISNANGINRLKTSAPTDVDVLSTKNNLKITSTTIDELSEYNLGGMIKITGLITEIKSNYMYLDDVLNEIKVAFKTGAKINKKSFKEGDEAMIIGVLEEDKGSWQLWPRFNVDIQSLGPAQPLISQEQTLKSASNGSVEQTNKYLKVTASGLGSLILGFLIRARGAFVLGGIKKAVLLAAKIVGRG